jgi:hypothetical protein
MTLHFKDVDWLMHLSENLDLLGVSIEVTSQLRGVADRMDILERIAWAVNRADISLPEIDEDGNIIEDFYEWGDWEDDDDQDPYGGEYDETGWEPWY